MTRPSGDGTQPTDDEIDALIARSDQLLNELRDTFAAIRAAARGETPHGPMTSV